MITKDNIDQMVVPYVKQWVAKVGGGQLPQHIYYFRDGVSEGQYSHVLNQEVIDMKAALVKEFKEVANNVSCSIFPTRGYL